MSTSEDSTSGELRDGYAEIGDQRLHYVEAGDGPLIVLLHGFPEFWYGWRQQIEPLAAAGFRVVAPDTRGYNLSSKPKGVKAYSTDQLAADIRRSHPGTRSRVRPARWSRLGRNHCLDNRHEPPRSGGPAGHPQRGPIPRKLSQGLHHPGQLRKSWYFFFFDLPELPEAVVHLDHWHFFRHFLRDARPPLTPEETDRYVEAWSQPGAATGMINYYRSSVRASPKQAAEALRPIKASTLVIWGQEDRYLGAGPGRTRPRRRPESGSRCRAFARCLSLGASRRARASQPAPHRLLRARPRSRTLTRAMISTRPRPVSR